MEPKKKYCYKIHCKRNGGKLSKIHLNDDDDNMLAITFNKILVTK